jgi:hypothetical protein
MDVLQIAAPKHVYAVLFVSEANIHAGFVELASRSGNSQILFATQPFLEEIPWRSPLSP